MDDSFVVVALLFLGAIGGYLLWQDYLMFRRPRIRTRGKVTSHRASEDDGSKWYFSRISFSDQFGKWHEFTDAFGRAAPKPDVGTEIAVVYPDGEPQRARVPRPLVRLLIYCFVFGAAALLTGVAAGRIN